MELLKEPHEIDWHGIRERREEFVYDSGCLNCHKYLQAARPTAIAGPSAAHRRYFQATPTITAVWNATSMWATIDWAITSKQMGWPKPQQGDEQ